MARAKRSSVVIDKAVRRIAGMRSLNDTLEFGDGLSLAGYDTRIQTLQTQLSSYNTMLSRLDEMAGQVTLLEQELSSYSEKMLVGVVTRYGRDSLQYVQAGGRPRKRSTRPTLTRAIAPETAPETAFETAPETAPMATTMATSSAATNGNGATASVS